MTLRAPLPLSVLSVLVTLGRGSSERNRLGELLSHWLPALKQTQTVKEPLTSRQHRRWQLLYAFWQNEYPRLISQMQKRGYFQATWEAPLLALTTRLQPSMPFSTIAPEQVLNQALFIAALPWGELYGETRPLELRELKFERQIPPFHLSARVKEASILSAGSLAIEALGKWLGQVLDASQAMPIWVEAAFPDDIRVTDESASLAFVAGAMQKILGLKVPLQAYSGIVRRDTGHVQQVQGFDLAYGKLEAAFDQGVKELFLPPQTLIQALPQAGICLQKCSDSHYFYYLEDQPEDQMQIYFVENLQALYEKAFLRHAVDLNPLQVLRQRLPASLIQPDFSQWAALGKQLLKLLPHPLPTAYARFYETYQQALAYQDTSLDDQQIWQKAQTDFQSFLERFAVYLACLRLLPALNSASLPEQHLILGRLNACLRPQTQVPTVIVDWETFWLDISQFVGSANCQLQERLESWLVLQARRLDKLFAPAPSQLSSNSLELAQSLWGQVSLLIELIETGDVLQDFQMLELNPHLAENQWQKANSTAGDVPIGTSLPVAPKVIRRTGFVWDNAARQLWASPLFVTDPQGQVYLDALELQAFQTCIQFERKFPDALFFSEQTAYMPIEQPFRVQLQIQLPVGVQVELCEQLPVGLQSRQTLCFLLEATRPGEPVILEYLCQAEPGFEQGKLGFGPPVAHRHRGSESEAVYLSYLSPQVRLVSTGSLDIQLSRSFTQTSNVFRSHQPFEMCLDIKNNSPMPVSHIIWPKYFPLPEGCQLLNADQLLLPETLQAFEHLSVNLLLCMTISGKVNFQGFALHCQPPDGQLQSFHFESSCLNFLFYGSAQMFGREQISEILLHWLQQPAHQAYYLSGDVGCGKQFLFQTCAELAGYHYVTPQLQAVLPFAYGSIKDILRQLLSWSIDLALKLPDFQFTFLTHFCQGSALHLEVNTRDNKEQLYIEIQNFLEMISQKQALLITLPEIEKVDHESLELLQYLLNYRGKGRLLFGFSGEPRNLPMELRSYQIPVLAVKGLGLKAVKDWLNYLFSPNDIHQSFSETLVKETSGNPLFIHELLAYFQETQQLYFDRAAHAWSLQQTDFSSNFPDSLDFLFAKKMQALEPERPILEVIAVYGENCSLKHLQAFLELEEERLEEALDKLISLRVIAEVSLDTFCFELPLLGKYLYSQLGRRARRLHLKIAEYLEALLQFSDIGQLEKLAYHFQQAYKPLKAFDYSLKSAWSYYQQGLLSSSRTRLEQVLSLLQAHPADLQPYTPDVFYLLGSVRRYSENLDSARQDYKRCLDFTDSDFSVRAKLALAQLSPPEEAITLFHQALSQTHDTPELYAETLLCLGRFYAQQAEPIQAQHYFQTALKTAPESSSYKAEVLAAWAYELIKQGEHQQAENLLLQSKEIYLLLQSESGLAQVNSHLGACCFYQQSLNKAEHYFQDCLQYYLKTHNKLKQTHIQHNLGLLYESQHNVDAAQSLYQHNLELSLALKNTEFAGFSALQLSSLALKARHLNTAELYLQQAANFLQNSSEKRGKAYLCLHQGQLALLQGRYHEAESQLRLAFVTFEALQDIMGQDRARMRLGHCLWMQGQPSAARELYLMSLSVRQELDKAAQDGLERVYHALGVLEAEAGNLEQATTYFEQAYQLLSGRNDLQGRCIVTKNRAWLSQIKAAIEHQHAFEQEYAMLNGLGTFPLQQELEQAWGFFLMLDD